MTAFSAMGTGSSSQKEWTCPAGKYAVVNVELEGMTYNNTSVTLEVSGVTVYSAGNSLSGSTFRFHREGRLVVTAGDQIRVSANSSATLRVSGFMEDL